MSPSPPLSTRTDLHFGATVHTDDGRRLGTLRRLIVDETVTELRDLVVRESRGFSAAIFSPGTPVLVNDLVVPLGLVTRVSRERIDLGISWEEARILPPYIHWRYVEPTDDNLSVNGLAVAFGGAGAPVVERTFAKSRDALEIQAGENVMFGRSGDRLGTVRDVVLDGGAVVGVVVHPSGFFTQDVLLPVGLLGRSDDMALIAALTREDADHLVPFEPAQD